MFSVKPSEGWPAIAGGIDCYGGKDVCALLSSGAFGVKAPVAALIYRGGTDFYAGTSRRMRMVAPASPFRVSVRA